MKDFLYSKEGCVIDQSIYHRDAQNTKSAQNLRLIGSWKFGQSLDSRLMILDPKTSTKKATFTRDEFHRSLVQVPFTKEQLEKAIYREIPLHYSKMSSKRATSAIKGGKDSKNNKSLTSTNEDDTYDDETLEEIIDFIAPALEQHGIPRRFINQSQSKVGYIYIQNDGNAPRKCPLSTKGTHINNNASVRIQPNGDARYYCFGSECKGKYLDLNVSVSTPTSTNDAIIATTNTPVVQEKKKTPQFHPIVSKMDQFRAHPLIHHRIVNTRYITDAMKQDDPVHSANSRLICILSPTGSGKTTYAQQMFKELLNENHKSVCVALSPRRSVTAQHEKNFREMGFIHYMKDKKLLPTCNRIISTLDSLFKIDKAIDILYIDEVESLLEHVFADTLKERNLVWSKLLQVCSTAKKVVVTDADFGDLSTTFFTEVIEAIHTDPLVMNTSQKNLRTIFLENTKQLDPLQITLTSTNRQWFVELEKALMDPASKIFIGCDSKRDARNIREKIIAWLAAVSLKHQNMFSPNDILLYTSKDGDCSDLSNADESWKDAKVVLCSPTIIYGVDYNNKDRPFTAVMGFYTQQGFTMGADKIRQQLRRARNIVKPDSQTWHMCIHIFQNPKQAHLKQFYPTDAKDVLSDLEQTCRSYASIISKLPIPITTDIQGNSAIMSDPLSRLYVEFLRKRNVSKFALPIIVRQLLTFEGHHVVTMPYEKIEPHPIWNSERFMVDVFQREQSHFSDAFDFLAIQKAQLALKRNLPVLTQGGNLKTITAAVEAMRDLLGIHDFADATIQNIKSSPFLMQFIQNPKLQTAVFKFQRLLRKPSRFVALEGADPNSPIKITMSEKYLLEVLDKVEEIMQWKRFECLYLTQDDVRSLYGEDIQVKSDLLKLMQNIGKYHFLPTSEVAFKKNGEHITKYHLYQWICKIYSYFCSTTNNGNGNKKSIIKSKGIPIISKSSFPKSKIKNPNPNEKYCDYCHTSKNIEKDFHKANRFCKECSHEFQHYSISKDSQDSLVRLLQFCFYFCQFRNYGALEMTFRLTEDIVARNLNYSIDLTMSPTFQTENCQSIQDVIHEYQNQCAIIFQEE